LAREAHFFQVTKNMRKNRANAAAPYSSGRLSKKGGGGAYAAVRGSPATGPIKIEERRLLDHGPKKNRPGQTTLKEKEEVRLLLDGDRSKERGGWGAFLERQRIRGGVSPPDALGKAAFRLGQRAEEA